MDELIYPDKKIPTKCSHCNELLVNRERKHDLSIPVTFYKYVPLEAAEKILSEGSLKLMHPIEANDTFEFMPAFEGTAMNKTLALDIIRQSKILISSFSRSCHIPAMWSHYAARFTGVCLGFKTRITCDFQFEEGELVSNNDLKAFPVLICESDHSIIFAPVLYMKKRIRPTENLESYINSYLPACVKNISWEYEHEFRLLLKENDASYVRNGYYFTEPVMSLLDCIILGPDCKVNTFYMRKFLESKGAENLPSSISIHQAEYHPYNFNISTPGHEDSLEDSNGEYQQQTPMSLTIGSSFSDNDIVAAYIGGKPVYQNSNKKSISPIPSTP